MTSFDATPEQLVALWDVADASKTLIGFWAGFAKRGSHRREAFAAIKALGTALDALDRATRDQPTDTLRAVARDVEGAL